MAIDVRLPSITGPSDSQRITQITRYLYQLAEDLKYNLNTLEAGTSDMASIERIGVLDALDDWKLTAQTSIATIRQKVSSQGASITSLAEWKSGVEGDVSSIASIEQRVTDAESTIKLLTELNAGDSTSLAELVNRVSAAEANITGLTTWKNGVVGSIAKIEQISTEDYSSITGLAQFRSDTAATEARIESKADANSASIGLVVDNGKVKGGILIEAINNESTLKISADRLDIEGKTLNIKVASTNIVGGLTIGQLPSNVATRENIPTDVGDLTNNAGYQTSSGVVSIIDGRITADFIKTLGLEVGNQIKMGAGATISWDNVSSKPTNLATTTDVSNAQNAAITSALDSVSSRGYQTESQVKTTIGESSIRTDQIECTDLNAFGATIGGFIIDNNSLNSSMSSTSNRILLCSGTSARYTVCGHSSTGWSLIAGSNFGVLKNGTMYASGANISGTLTTGSTTGNKDFGVTVGDGCVHVTSNAYKELPADSGEAYLLMKFDVEDGHTWGLFASGPYVDGGNVELKSLFVERLDRY